MDTDRLDALEMMLAQIGQLERGAQRLACQPLHSVLRQQDLIRIGRALQSRGRWQGGAEKIPLAARARQARVNTEPDLEPPRRAPRDVAHLALRLDRSHHRIERPVECRQHAVARASEGIAGMAADRSMEDLIVQIHRRHHVIGKVAQQRRAAHDVGRENCSFVAIG